MKNESKVFSLYTAKNNTRPALMHPFVQNGHVFASDGHILIMVNKNETKVEYPHSQKPDCSLLFIDTRKELLITMEELEGLLSGVEQVEETRTVGEDIECRECKGVGEVTWEYERWAKDFDCPVCNGSGYSSKSKEISTGKMIPDPFAAVKIGSKTFKASYVKTLVDTMKLLEIYGIVMRYNARSFEQVIFNFGTNINVLLMPYNKKGFKA